MMENKVNLTKFERGRVSIIMPLYNMEKLVERAVMSVIDQTYDYIASHICRYVCAW